MATQRIRIISRKDGKARGIAIKKSSVGTIYVKNVPYSYNLDKLNIPLDKTPIKRKKKKKKVYRKKKGWWFK